MGRACSTNEAKRNTFSILMGKPDRNRSLGRPTRRWEDSFKMDLREIESGSMNWIIWHKMGTSGVLL
jgi:hypothetical protein